MNGKLFDFIKSLDKLSDKEKEQAYLDNKEFIDSWAKKYQIESKIKLFKKISLIFGKYHIFARFYDKIK